MQLFHAVNRGVESRDLFLDSQDYARFVHNLYEFNDTSSSENLHRLLPPQMNDLGGRSFAPRRREQLVDIHAWCLMRNHFHLLLSENAEKGISRFLMKLNVGYAKYFNEKYRRGGHLFQGKTKRVPLENEAHFLYILHYIHLNPLDYLAGAQEWRLRHQSGISDAEKALQYLETYRWSSYLDYCGKKNFPSIITTSLYDRGEYVAELTAHLSDSELPPELKLE